METKEQSTPAPEEQKRQEADHETSSKKQLKKTSKTTASEEQADAAAAPEETPQAEMTNFENKAIAGSVKENEEIEKAEEKDKEQEKEEEKEQAIIAEKEIEEAPEQEQEPEKATEEEAEEAPEQEQKPEKATEEKPEVKVRDNVQGDSDEDQSEDLSEKYISFSREGLIEALEVLVTNEDMNQIRRHIGYIKAAYRRLLKDEHEAAYEKRMQKDEETETEQEPAPDVFAERFDAALQVYRDKKAVYDQALELQKQQNLIEKERILEELRNLIESEEELKRTYDQFRELQDQWKEVGPVPQSSKSTLWNNYHFLVEKFFDKVKINKELKDLDLKKNLEVKTELCEKAEELLLEASITKSFQQLQKLHEAWKEIGPVQKDKKDEIWERFKSATDKLNKRRQEYYDSLREEQNKNYAAKYLLCEKAEQLSDISPDSPRQWQQYTDQVNELFKMWKSIGFAPKKVNTEVWNRFRNALDTFYKNKKEFFKKYKEQQTENYNQKLNLCVQAEALKRSEDWRATTEDLISLQKEWKKIGPVPAKYSDKIWKRFRAACDEFFNNKSAHFSNIGEKQEENLEQKLALIERVKNHSYTADNTENLKTLKDFQREWMEIGHVPIKQKDKVQNEFRKVIDKQFEVLNISKKAKTTLSFRNKMDNLKNAPNADNLINRERHYLTGKINAIESDIKVWENNIGFFASSKKADILKAEFEEKIDKGKQEIAILEEKLRILREA